MLRRSFLTVIYIAALFFSVPLSLAVWFVRREICKETSVAGGSTIGGTGTKKAVRKDANDNFEVRVVERTDH